MNRILVAGSGTEVGKTIVSAILTTLLKGDYWKPIQCGDENFDSETMKKLIDNDQHHIFPSAYSLKAPLSPHHAAQLENITIQMDAIKPPETTRPLIIESVGGIFVPLTPTFLSFDLFQSWKCQWIVVSKHYVGSINHTLLTVDALKKRDIPLIGIIFNGEPNLESEKAILEFSQIPCLGRLFPETNIDPQIIQRYAKEWTPLLSPYFP